jgi:hypothetical protein
MPWSQFPKILAILRGGYKAKANIDLAKNNIGKINFLFSRAKIHISYSHASFAL